MTTYYVTTSGNDSNAGTSEGAAFASPGKAAGVATTSGDLIAMKSGTYTLTSSTANVSGGKVSLSQGVRMEGYGSTIGDLGTPPVINAGAITGITIVAMTNNYNVRPSALVNVEVDGNSGASNKGVTTTNYTANIIKCIARNCPGDGFTGTINIAIVGCSAISCAIGFNTFSAAHGCVAEGCSSYGFSGIKNAYHCRASGNGNHGFYTSLDGWSFINCVAHGNTGAGFSTTYDEGMVANCISTSNTTYGYSFGGATNGVTFINSAHRANGTSAFQNTTANKYGEITLSADPYTNAGSNDYSLNTTSGGGADLRAAGFPGAIPGASGTGYLDIGLYQHQDSGGGGGLAGQLVGRGTLVHCA